ncbi:MAG TPA: GAF domain-containing protein [Campylobacterales bacterium]|nr:GAF domain-containing protein [Campylobacterales bacterium]
MIDKEELEKRIEEIIRNPEHQKEKILELISQVSNDSGEGLQELMDFFFQYQVEKEKHLHKIIDIILDYSTKISKEQNSETLLLILADFGKTIVESDRATLWLIDEVEGVFWTKVGHGISNIKIPLSMGIIGEVYATKETITVNDPYNHPKFNPEIDKKTNYKTNSILATPIFDKKGNMIGVFQAINKLNEQQQFLPEDTQLFNIVVSYISNILDVDHLAQENRYFIQEQTKAAQKQQAMLVNELKNDDKLDVTVYFKPYDFLSGDSYSLHKLPDGGYLIYVLDAMGHGIVPSLTCVSVLSFVKKGIEERLTFSELANAFGKSLEYILSDLEQLSATFIHIDKDLQYVEYFSAGMYPTLVKNGDEIIELKANNIPFMNFFLSIKVDKIETPNFEKLLVYSDGITEDTNYYVEKNDMHIMLDKDILANYFEVIKDKKMDDDVTAVLIEKKENNE